MALSGYRKECRKTSGGIEWIALIEVAAVQGVVYDAVNDYYIGLAVKTGAGFSRYGFAEDKASYVETVTISKGQAVVKHELDFTLRGMNDSTRKSIEELVAEGKRVVVLFRTQQRETYLAGYSEKFGTERSLRMEKVSGTTGQTPAEGSEEKVRFVATDTTKAKLFAGEIPWLG